MKAEVRKATALNVVDVETTAKKRVQRGPKTGEVYKKGNPARVHQASAPSESPATDTGDLVRKINGRLIEDGLAGEVVSASAHSKPLEHGTRNMAARPFLLPALRENAKKIKRRYEDAVKKGVKKAKRRR